MKTIVKYIVAVFALATISLNAATLTQGVTSGITATNSLIGTNAVWVSSVAFANPTAVTATYSLYDAPASTLTYTRGAYTNWISFTTNYVTTITNFSGVVQSETNAAVYTVANPVSSATGNYRLLVTVAVPAGETYTYQPNGGVIASFGVAVVTSTNGTFTLNYSSIK